MPDRLLMGGFSDDAEAGTIQVTNGGNQLNFLASIDRGSPGLYLVRFSCAAEQLRRRPCTDSYK
jgi:hypothetical protein